MCLENPIIYDFCLAVPMFLFIILVIKITEKIGEKYAWINRKLIHLSSVPAALAYGYLFKEPFVFSGFALLLTILTLITHLKRKEIKSFQIENNYGEVYYCLMWTIIGFTMWNWRILAMLAMLAMAIGDSVTGIVRFYYYKKKTRHKGILGSIAMFIVCVLIFGIVTHKIIESLILALVAILLEKQPLIDDNITVPIGVILLGWLLFYFL